MKPGALSKIVEVVCGDDEETLDKIAALYEIIVKAGVHSILIVKVAEAVSISGGCRRQPMELYE